MVIKSAQEQEVGFQIPVLMVIAKIYKADEVRPLILFPSPLFYSMLNVFNKVMPTAPVNKCDEHAKEFGFVKKNSYKNLFKQR